jgi:hypothetical protein
MWGGIRVYLQALSKNVSTKIFEALEQYNTNLQDPDAHLIISSTYTDGITAFTVSPYYTKPVKNPPVFKNFTAIKPELSTMRITNVTSLTKELYAATTAGSRYLFATATFKNDAVLFAKLLDINYNGLSSIKKASGLLASMVLQPISPLMTARSAETGGNALGVDPEDGPLTCKIQHNLHV